MIISQYRQGSIALPAVLCAVLVAAGCGPRPEGNGVAPDAPLAEVDGVAITESEFQSEVERRLAAGRPVGEKEQLLHELIERKIMLQRAESSAMMGNPAVRRELENEILVRWLDRSLEAKKDQVTVSEAELRRAYEEDREAFTSPARIRLAILYRRLSRRGGAEQVDALREELEDARERYLADPDAVTQGGRIPGFGTVAATSSEDTVSRYRGGDLGWLEVGRADYRWPENVVRTGFGLEVGEMSDVLVADDGLYVVMKTGERDARVTPFDEAVVGLRRRMLRERRADVEQFFREELVADARIVVNTDKVARLQVPVPEPNVPPALSPRAERAPDPMVP